MYEVSSLQKTGTQTQNHTEMTKYGNRLPKSFLSRNPEVNSLATPTVPLWWERNTPGLAQGLWGSCQRGINTDCAELEKRASSEVGELLRESASIN